MSCANIGRTITAAVLVTAGAALVLGLPLRRRAAPAWIARCPIHGIAYDREREVCPECATTQAVASPARPETPNLETTGGGQ